MTTGSLNIVNAKVWNGIRFIESGIAVSDGLIIKIAKEPNLPKANEILDANGKIVLPGFIDVHTHLRDSDYSYKEDFETGTSGAVAGGFTTLLDMPNTSPPITNASILKTRIESAKGRIYCDVGFYATANIPSEIQELAKSGCIGFKAYLHKAIGGVSFESEESIETLAKAAKASNRMICFHAEDPTLLIEGNLKTPTDHLNGHPAQAEFSAIRMIIQIARKTPARVHVCHLSTVTGLKLIAAAKKEGIDISSEATPHHMLLDSSILNDVGSIAVVEPPLRTTADAKAIRLGVYEGLIPIIATDHAPHSIDEKLDQLQPGFPGLETLAGLLLTLVNKDELPIKRVIDGLTKNPAERFGLRKIGKIGEGYRANLTIIDPKKDWKIDPKKFYSKAKYSPFQSRRVRGKVLATIVAGTMVYEDGEIVSDPPGQVLLGNPFHS